MTTGETQAELVRKQLQRVLASSGFARNERLSRLLRFVVERRLEGRDADLKESLIGIEVFGRRAGFDPQQDSTVRSEAARLRARLAEYYVGEGSGDTMFIDLPKGGYTPLFRQQAPQVPDLRSRSRRLWLAIAVAGLAIVLAATAWWRLQYRTAPVSIAVLP